MEGLEAPATDRLFFAIYPSAETASLISQLGRRCFRDFSMQGVHVAEDRLHATLHHLGDYAGVPRGVVAKAHEAASSIHASPLAITFDRLASFPGKSGKSLLVLRGGDGLRELEAFQLMLGEGMAKAGLGKRVEKRFTPHMTLAYADRSLEEQAIGPLSWTASEFILVHSLLGRTQHIILARWPLKADAS